MRPRRAPVPTFFLGGGSKKNFFSKFLNGLIRKVKYLKQCFKDIFEKFLGYSLPTAVEPVRQARYQSVSLKKIISGLALRIFLIFCMELGINKDYKLTQTPFSGRSLLGGYGAQKGPQKAENMTHLTLTGI